MIRELKTDRFSLKNFYERRARRLLPALFLVTFVSITIAYFTLLPNQMRDFSQSVVAISFFASNILFWYETDYFHPSVDEKPLLHTWSLAVEEQYYFLFPLLLMLIWRTRRQYLVLFLSITLVTSFIASQAMNKHDFSASFYLIPFRIWELMCGSLVAIIVQEKKISCNNCLSLLGLSGILISIVSYNEKTVLNPLLACIPIIGTLLIIIFGTGNTIVSKLLSSKLFVGIGLISYSTYLWHQPVFAFSRAYLLNEPSAFLMSVLIGLAFFLGAISWKYIEQPFRYYYRFNIFRATLFMSMAFIIFGFAGHFTTGFTQRFGDEFQATVANSNDTTHRLLDNGCHLNGAVPAQPMDSCSNFLIDGKADVILIGDSHLDVLAIPIQKRLFEYNVGSYALSYSGCIPIRSLSRIDLGDSHRCADFNNSMIEFAEEQNSRTIILVGRFPYYLSGSPYDNGEGGKEKANRPIYDRSDNLKNSSDPSETNRLSRVSQVLSEELIKLTESFNVLIFSPIPELGWDALKYHMIASDNRRSLRQSPALYTHDLKAYENRVRPFYQILDDPKLKRINVFNTSKTFCDEKINRCRFKNEKGLLYRDDDHLSKAGAELLVKEFFVQYPPTYFRLR